MEFKIRKLKIKDLFYIEKGSLQSSKCKAGEYDFITASSEWKKHNEYTHDTEALIIAVAASGSLGRVHYVKGKFISSDLCFILTQKSKTYPVDLSFYLYIFKSIRDDLVKATATGTSKLAINKANFGDYEIPYVDIQQQEFIKRKLVEFSEKRDMLIDNHKEQTDLIRNLRQKVLQDAITGKLSEQWRKENHNVESAEVLLNKIKAEKEKQIKEGQIKRQNPLPPIQEDEIPFDLPVGWVWCKLQELIESIQYGISTKCIPEKHEGMSAVLRIPNVSGGEITIDDLKYAELSAREKMDLDLKKGDLLIIRSNGSKDIVGQAILVRQNMEDFSYAGYLIRLRTFTDPDYLLACFRSNMIRQQIETPLRTTVGINNINTTELSNLLIPLPSNNEQLHIVHLITEIFHKLDSLKANNTFETETISLLNQIILKEMSEE